MKAETSEDPLAPPRDFRPLRLSANPFLDMVGPLYGRLDEGRLVLGLRVEPRHCSPSGMLHGGMLMTLADMLLILGSNHEAGIQRFMSTVNVSIDFLSPAPAGQWIEGRAQVLRVTRNLVFAQGLFTVGDQVAARVSGILKPLGEPDPRHAAARYLG